MTAHRRPEDLLPLTTVAFEILLTLFEGPAHGYHVMQAVESRTGGAIVLHPGTLYRAMARLEEEGLIEEGPVPATARGTGANADRRRAYAITAFGRAVTEAEAARLEQQVRHAKALRVLRR